MSHSDFFSLLFVFTVSFLPDGIDSLLNKTCHNGECSDMTIDCHQTDECLIQCVDDNSCKNTTINCPINSICEIECDGIDSCIDMTIFCPSISTDDSNENCVVQGNEKFNGLLSGLTIYAFDGWSQIDIDYRSTDNNLGKLLCGSSFEFECNIAMINDEYTCSEPDHPCNEAIVDIETIDSEEERAWTISLDPSDPWTFIIGGIAILIIIACCVFMQLLVYKTCMVSGTEESPKQTQPTPRALELQQQKQNHLTINHHTHHSQPEISVAHASVASMQIIPSSAPSFKSNMLQMSKTQSAPFSTGPAHRYLSSQSAVTAYSPNNSPQSSPKKRRTGTWDLSASLDPKPNNSYLQFQRHSVNLSGPIASSAVVQSSTLQRKRSASSITGSVYQANNKTLSGLGTERSLRAIIGTIDEDKSEDSGNNEKNLPEGDIKTELHHKRNGSTSSLTGSQYGANNNLSVLGTERSLRGMNSIRAINEQKSEDSGPLPTTLIQDNINTSSDVNTHYTSPEEPFTISDDDIKSNLPLSPAVPESDALKASNPYLAVSELITPGGTPLHVQHQATYSDSESRRNEDLFVNKSPTPNGTPNGSPEKQSGPLGEFETDDEKTQNEIIYNV